MRGEATVRFEMGTVFVCRTDFDSLVAMHKPFQKKSCGMCRLGAMRQNKL